MKQNKKIVYFLGMLGAIVLTSFLLFLYGQKHISAKENQEQVLTIRCSKEMKNEYSWGKELRFYYIRINGQDVDLNECAETEGWSIVDSFLFCEGDNAKELVIKWPDIVKSVDVKYCQQNGSGIVEIYYNNECLGDLDMYNAEWRQGMEGFQLDTMWNRIALWLGVFCTFMIAIWSGIHRLYKIKENTENNSVRKINKLGMFDLAKGFAMLLVVFNHSFVYYYSSELLYSSYFFRIPMVIIWVATMTMFFVASGYGFKEKSVKECLKTQSKLLLKPYLIVGIISTVLIGIISIVRNRNVLVEVIRVGGAFLLGADTGHVINGYEIGTIGPLWFMLSLFIAWNLLNAIFKIPIKWIANLLIIVLFVVGAITNKLRVLPYCLGSAFLAVVVLFIGKKIKDTQWLQKESKKKIYAEIGMVFVAGVAAVLIRGSKITLVTLLVDEVAIIFEGILFLSICVWLGKYKNFFFDKLKTIGRYSYWILCVHTVEMLCFPWDILSDYFKEQRVLGIAVIFLGRGVIILGGCMLLQYINKQRMKRLYGGIAK